MVEGRNPEGKCYPSLKKQLVHLRSVHKLSLAPVAEHFAPLPVGRTIATSPRVQVRSSKHEWGNDLLVRLRSDQTNCPMFETTNLSDPKSDTQTDIGWGKIPMTKRWIVKVDSWFGEVDRATAKVEISKSRRAFQ